MECRAATSAFMTCGGINIAEARDGVSVPEAVQRLIRLRHLARSLEWQGVEVSAGVMWFQRGHLSVLFGL
jgi:hypothetical protein